MLELADVHAHYGKSHVLQGVSLSVEAGQVVGLVGRNGVGKTTTLKTVVGLVRASAGRIALDGRVIAGWPPYRIVAAGVAWVPEERRVFPQLTVGENLLVGIRHLPAADQAARLDETFGHFPRLRERQRQLGGSLSGGEQQMLAIARALVTRPRLVLIDEPSEGLMPKLVDEVSAILDLLRADRVSVLLVDQNLELLRTHCAIVHLMERGRMVQTFAGRDLEGTADLIRQYLGVDDGDVPPRRQGGLGGDRPRVPPQL